jgi:hypothetical protein
MRVYTCACKYIAHTTNTGKTFDHKPEDTLSAFSDGRMVFVARSESYGLSAAGMISVRILNGQKLPNLSRRTSVFAIRGPNIATERTMLECLLRMKTSRPKLLAHILRPVSMNRKLLTAGNTGKKAGNAGKLAGNGGSGVMSLPIAARLRKLYENVCRIQTQTQTQTQTQVEEDDTDERGGGAFQGGDAVRPSPNMTYDEYVTALCDAYMHKFSLDTHQRRVLTVVKSWLTDRNNDCNNNNNTTTSSREGEHVHAGQAHPTAGNAGAGGLKRLNLTSGMVINLTSMHSSVASSSTTQTQNPIALVHGVFGSGKTRTLIALTMFLVELSRALTTVSDSPGGALRVLVVGWTNVAVDRVLLGVQQRGCEDFVRVGSVRR